MTGWIYGQTGATVYEIVKHLEKNKPTVCIYCETDQKFMFALRNHISACWMMHGLKWKEATK